MVHRLTLLVALFVAGTALSQSIAPTEQAGAESAVVSPTAPPSAQVPWQERSWVVTSRRLTMFANALLYGLIAGNFMSVQIGQVPFQNTLGARDYTLVKHGTELFFGPAIPPFMVVADILPLAQLALIGDLKKPAFWLTAAGYALMIAATLVTAFINLPVNAQAAKWDPENPPANWQQLRDQWNTGQALRTGLSIPAAAAMVAAAVFN